MKRARVLSICGSLRQGSVNAAVLDTAADLDVAGITVHRYDGMAALPHFNPDDDRDPLHVAVAELRAAIAAADALLFCTPEYAGALPGSFKNLLDWTVGGVETSDRRAGWINAGGPDRAIAAHASLASVLRYTGARLVDEACVSLAVPRDKVGPSGRVEDPDLRARIAGVLRALVEG